jgi:hypothetical protein
MIRLEKIYKNNSNKRRIRLMFDIFKTLINFVKSVSVWIIMKINVRKRIRNIAGIVEALITIKTIVQE